MNRYKELNVWKKSIDLVVEIYNSTSQFPDSEKFGLMSQINRAAVSIPSNIAEGSGRSSNKDFSKFLDYSNGSASELETQLIISEKLKFINNDELSKLSKEIADIQNMIYGLKKSLKSTT